VGNGTARHAMGKIRLHRGSKRTIIRAVSSGVPRHEWGALLGTPHFRTPRGAKTPLNWIKETSVSSAKEAMIDLIGRQPDDSSYDEILRELAFARMVQRGVDDSDAGQTLSDDGMKRKIDSWQK
jgi:hypothetical protein